MRVCAVTYYNTLCMEDCILYFYMHSDGELYLSAISEFKRNVDRFQLSVMFQKWPMSYLALIDRTSFTRERTSKNICVESYADKETRRWMGYELYLTATIHPKRLAILFLSDQFL